MYGIFLRVINNDLTFLGQLFLTRTLKQSMFGLLIPEPIVK